MKKFSTDQISTLEQATFASMAIGDYFVARNVNNNFVKFRKVGEDSAMSIDIAAYRRKDRLGFSAGAVHRGIEPSDRYFRCAVDSFI